MRLIDADALFEVIKKSMDENPHIEETQRAMHIHEHKYFLTLLAGIPTIQPEPQWIPVSERMPSDGTWNIFTDGKNISVERYKADAIDHFFPNGRWFQLEDVIAWMPLPKPYKPNEKQSGKEGA